MELAHRFLRRALDHHEQICSIEHLETASPSADVG